MIFLVQLMFLRNKLNASATIRNSHINDENLA